VPALVVGENTNDGEKTAKNKHQERQGLRRASTARSANHKVK
jgi:hypothetical protein